MAAELARNPDERLAALQAELSQYVPPAEVAPGVGASLLVACEGARQVRLLVGGAPCRAST